MLDGGTIRVMKGRTINEGEEILMAYYASYWSRWAPRASKRRRDDGAADGEPAAAGGSSAEDGGAEVGELLDNGDAERGVPAAAGGSGEGSPSVRELGADGGGYGRRVRGRESRERPITGNKRGRPPKTVEASSSGSRARRTMRQLLWTDTGREEYVRTVACGNVHCGNGEAGTGQRFERGEGGGVT